jgi:hypothetical protein
LGPDIIATSPYRRGAGSDATRVRQLGARSRRVAAGVANDPDKLLERANLRFSLASIALPYDARAIVEHALSPQPFDQAAKQCHVSPHARDR